MRLGFYGIISICTFITVCLIQVSPCKGSSTCNTNYFTCDNGFCIPQSWKCDGEEDCDDGSDEKDDYCNRKKRSTTEGLLYHESYLFDCHPNYLRCPEEIQCIPMAKFCDNHIDCPMSEKDEGIQCKDEKRINDCTAICSNGGRCAVSKQFDTCYCEDRYKLYNNSECVQDVNECLYEGYCDQLCTDKEPGYKCNCVSGYIITGEGYCKAINVPSRQEATLLVADYDKVLQVNLDGEEIEPPISIAGHRIMTIDFDHRNDSACWITYHLEERKSYLQCISLQDRNNHWQIETEISLDTVEHFAKDWLTGNLYFTNSVLDHRFIVVCNSQGKMCKAIIKFTDEIPKGLALDPTRGYLFFITWSEGQQSSIEQAFMDGSNRTVIQNDQSGAPYGITLDYANEHIYWTDEGSSLIKRMNYDGTNRKLVYMPQRLKDNVKDIQGFGLSVFENYLYVSSQSDSIPGIMKLHRYNYSEPVQAIVRYLERPFQLQVYHRQKQPNLPKPNINPCTADPPPCDQLCIIQFEENDDGTKHAAAQCLCGAGYQLEGGKCKENKNCTQNCQEDKQHCDEQCQLDHSCSPDYTRCPGGECIPSKWWCDAETDCPDGTDEQFCEQRTCTVLEFRCGNSRCIEGRFQCDYTDDCEDGSDERGCPTQPVKCDPETHIQCNDSGNIICLSAEYRCDKEQDCPDGSDEANCNYECDNKTEFACSDHRCIPVDWKCDGDDDCGDHSDERQCGDCAENHFQCKDKKGCVPAAWKCDKDYDCEDRSDEQNCPEACLSPNVTCPNEPSKCLTLSMLCNSKSDCTDGWDETGFCQSDTTECNIKCDGKCKKTPNGFVCECPKGKKLAADNATCEFINICHTWGICSQNCSLKDGKSSQHYTCSCFEGYNLTTDGYTCKAVDPSEVYIIFSNRHEMRRVDLTDYKYPAPLVSGLKNTIALDFYYKDSYIFWTDVVDDKIYRGKMFSHSLTNIEPIIDVGLATTEGLAVDWIGENIYWVESNLDQIEVAKLNGSIRTTLIAGDMDSPRAIVVDPREGWMFWTDWHAPNPRIERCSMTGDESTRQQIYSINQITEGGWPNGLTIDYDFYRLYWIDARSDSIHTIKYDGSDHRTVLKDHERIGHPFAITLFGQYVYWTDWTTNELVKANKFNGSNLTVIQRTMTQPFDLQVYHPKRQPDAFNPCANNNGGCSHLCLIGRNGTIGCRCPHLSRLKEDGKTCEPENRFLLFVKSKEIRGVDLRNPNFNAIPTLTVPYVDNPAAIDYDIIGDRLYWADTGLNKINSAYVNGSGVETIIDSGISNPEGFAIDWLSRNMYFSSTSVSNSKKKASISVAKLDGAFRAEIIINDLIQPNSIAVHPTKGLMFWADVHKIYRAKMDGTDTKVIVNHTKNPTSLTVDMENHQLFYINRGNNSVMSCTLDGISCRLIKHFQNQEPLLSLTLYNSNTLYVSNGEEIGKMNTTGLGYQALRKQTPQVQALLVYDENNRKKVTENGNECAKEKSYGNCAQLCLPTSRDSRVCMCTAGFKRVNDTKCVGITSFLMFSTEKEIRGISFKKNETEEALPLISKISMANGIDFDARMDMIYWVDSSSHTISRIKRDLTERETIVTDEIPGIEDIAVDWISGNVYWTDHLQDVIEVVRTNNSRYVVVHGNLEKPKSVVVHPVMGYLFWSDVGKRKIEQSKLDGSERIEIITTDITEPTGLTIDYDENVLYWCDKTLEKIESYDLKTGTRKVVVQSGVNACTSLTLYNEHLYWLEATTKGTIKRAHKKTGQDISTMRSDLVDNLRDIVAFERSRQNGTNVCEQNNGDCVGLCFHTGNNNRNCACSYGSLDADKRSCKEHGEFLLYSKITSIESIHMTRRDPNPPLRSIKNANYMKNVIGLTADFEHKRIYYSDIQRGDIQFVYFNGTKFTVIIDSVGSAEGLAFKPAFGNNTKPYLYWTSYTNSSIGRVQIHPENGTAAGKIEKVLQLGIDDHPRAIVIDSCSSQMFWTNWNDMSPKIQRAYLNGYQAESIITTDIRTPNGLAIDHLNQKLYWSDARLDKIEYADFDGKNRVVLLTDVPQHPFGLVVYGDYIYWTDWMLRAVVRINKYDNSFRTYLRSQLERQPMGIIAVAEDMDDCTVNPCFENNFGCEGECLVKLGRGYCSCGEGKMLLPDGKRCGGLNDSCGIDHFLCHDHSACIEYSQTCDYVPNCLDGSDEFKEVCERTECDAGWFTCRNHICVSHDARCNGENDCGDGSDETGCHCNKETQFQCKTGLCIKKQYRCDRDRDCPDFSDEIGCNLGCENIEMMQKIPGHFVSCNTTSQCIMEEWICDGNADCWDNNDERDCSIDTTDHDCPGSFQCNTSKSCIPSQWQCDSDDDCGDGSDEKNCTYKCEDHMFRCDDNTCLPRSWKCDGHPDCLDHSDEGNSCKENPSCKDDEFNCTNGRCIPKQWMCDGDSDCTEGEDERVENGCEPVKCDEEEFECLNRRCIKKMYYCDRDNDCSDNSDEPPTCVYKTCSPSEFQCVNNGTCIDMDLKCNGFPDCPDHSDEEDCGPEIGCTQYQCSNGVCLNDSLVCNGENDCGDNSDESLKCFVNECETAAAICSQKCIDLKIGHKCGCNEGYQLRADNYTCEDVDECKTVYPCSQFCVNTDGSFKCLCAEGYKMQADKRTCKVADDVRPYLLLANRYYIRNVSFSGDQHIISYGLSNAVAIDFHWADQMIYWTDITSKNSSICRLNITSQNNTKEVLLNTTVKNPDGIAVDWVAKNLYWCDKTTDTIEVSKLDGKYRKVLINTGLQEPRGLEVFPSKGLLFYTDWGETSHVSRANMDGTDNHKIISQDIAWPNALTIDYITEKIFWADASLDYIAMANLDGTERHVILEEDLPHTFALTTFMDYIFWTDWEHLSIQKAHKFSGADRSVVAHLVHRPMDIQVFHPVRQVEIPEYRNPCHKNNGCSHLCLLRPNPYYQSIEAVCACPENFYLGIDGKTCISNCTSSQFHCVQTSKCIPKWWYCDDRVDCEDRSDEPPTCGQYICSQPGMFRCDNGTTSDDCITPIQICDGKSQCADGSDEKDCENFTCLDGFQKCQNEPKCYSETRKCDGTNDCSNGEDELNCANTTCKSTQFQCQNGRCVPYVWHCDQDDDCGDMSDEPDFCDWTNNTCRPNYIKCAKSGRCIPESWQCDGDHDCGTNDPSDENPDVCSKQTCSATYFRCKNSHCIPGRWRCDYDNDCRDGSDEENCQYRNCSESEFRCGNHKCIPKKLKCDGEINCEDGSDETANCTSLQCVDGEFQCKKIPFCIPKDWHCDEDTDCSDGSDEWNCTHKCEAGQFQCNNSICIPGLWMCDTDSDCDDGSDEDNFMCSRHACAPGRFRCSNNKCISIHATCDGKDNCGDNSDEKYCEAVSCKRNEFKCTTTNQCIPTYKLCDKTNDCHDRSDESSKICNDFQRCSNRNPCEHNCQHNKQMNIYICSCNEGYKLQSDGRSCRPVNSCKMYGTCPQKCTKVQTKTKCYCDVGYEPTFTEESGHQCKAKGTKPHLLVGVENEFIRIHSPDNVGNNSGDTHYSETDYKLSRIDAVDLDTQTGNPSTWEAYILNYHNRTISKMPITAPKGKSEATNPKTKNKPTRLKRATTPTVNVIVSGLAEPHGIAVDWIGKHLYWTDSGTRKVEMAMLDDPKRITVAHGHLNQPFSIAVHPEAGKIYWTDRGYPAKIESANLDGSGRKELVKDDIVWPNGLTVDYANDRIYWADTKKHVIETVDLQGRDRHIVQEFHSSDPPYKLKVFEDFLYVTLYKSQSLVKIHKFQVKNTQQSTVLLKSARIIGDIVILHPSLQKSNITNYCDGSNCGNAICVNMPQSRNYSCVCDDEAKFNATTKKCEFLKNCTCKNNGTCSRIDGQPKCRCLPGYTGSKCERDMCTNFCQHGGVCVKPSKPNTPPTCNCINGFYGPICENYLCNGVCENGGRCSIVNNAPSCQCRPGFTGDRCQNGVQDSICENFCENGGKCNVVMVNHLFGGIRVPRPFCKCTKDFTGERCDQCTSLICHNGGTCHKNATNDQFYCRCPEKFQNDPTCLWLPCTNLCLNGGVCVTDARGFHMCKCPAGYSGFRCGDEAKQCPTYCKNGASCKTQTNTIEDIICICPDGYSGKQCQIAGKCANYCKNGGKCSLDSSGNPQCICDDKLKFEGEKCDKCKCKNDGICFQKGQACNCPSLYHGELCETSVCSTFCFNDGKCMNCSRNPSTNEPHCKQCICQPGFTGQRCEKASPQKQSQASSLPIVPIIVPVVAVLLLIILATIIFVLIRRKRDQFKHRRMPSNGIAEVGNPIYNPHSHEEDDDGSGREMENMFHSEEDPSTHFANPMYDRFQSESTQVLLQNDDGDIPHSDENGDIFINKKSSKRSPKKTPKKNQSNKSSFA